MGTAGCYCSSECRLPRIPRVLTSTSERCRYRSARRPGETLRAVGIVRDFTFVVENHRHTFLGRIAGPFRYRRMIRIADARERDPCLTHFIGEREFRRRVTAEAIGRDVVEHERDLERMRRL